MIENGKTCDDLEYLRAHGCNLPTNRWREFWSTHKWCQLSCFQIGAYKGDVCNTVQAPGQSASQPLSQPAFQPDSPQLARAQPEAFAGDVYIEHPELAAYRDEGSCGQMGKDYQSHFCHGLEMAGNGCKSPVLTEYCESGTATLLSIQGDGASYSSVNIDGCGYAFFAQYVCGEASIVTGFCRYGDNQNEHLSANAITVQTGNNESKEESCKQQCESYVNCTAYAFTSESSYCDLYQGGPYTYGSGRAGTTCNILPDEDQLFLEDTEMQDGEDNGLQSRLGGVVNGATYFDKSLVVLATVALMSLWGW